LISAQNFTVYNSWDFEKNNLGKYTDDQVRTDFDVVTLFSHHSADIVSDTINGESTKVMRITHPANQLSNGFELYARLVKDFDEVYLTYNFKFSEEFNSTAGGKLPGLGGFPSVQPNQIPKRDQGFVCKLIFKRSGRIYTYHYDRTPPAYPVRNPWSNEAYKFDTIFITNGSWYNITQRLKMNSFTNGIPNGDGIHEVWINGHLLYQEDHLVLMQLESDDMKIDKFILSNFYGGSSEDYKPRTQCYGYIDNITLWNPLKDPVKGFAIHDPDLILTTPGEITDRNFYYDVLITDAGTLSNSQYDQPYSPCIDETYLIDAGKGKRIIFEFTNGAIGRGDGIYVYDGITTDSRLIGIYQDMTFPITGIFRGSGRYMFIRFSTDSDQGLKGWTGNMSFIPERQDNTTD